METTTSDKPPTTTPFSQSTITYGSAHSLQTYTLTQPTATSLDKTPGVKKYFTIYIHGGAWRDPHQSSADFHPATSLLLNAPAPQIAALVSLNYGLSPYPSDPSDDPGRNYRHEMHIDDIMLALQHLHRTLDVGKQDGWEYILIGHSCGATLAFQAVARLLLQDESGMEQPVAVLGVEGIYDIPLLLTNHETSPVYREFITGAFKDEARWTRASPVHFPRETLARVIKGVEVIVIAHSRADELVEIEQATRMLDNLNGVAETKEEKGKIVFGEIEGKHDETWRDGHGVALIVQAALEYLGRNEDPYLIYG